MRLKWIELSGFKSFAKKTSLEFEGSITAVVGPNGSGKSNIAEAFRFCLGEQSIKSMRGRRGEDLIWNGSTSSPRAGRARVALAFDNRDRTFNLDFDEVLVERAVNRDGSSDYLLNGSTVRLRDSAGLLSQANIGASGHHIVSQGEADRILSASARERREMVEDALGLTGFLYKREEAEHKLQKTAENVREVEASRREVAPHLKFLHGQVKKIEETQKTRDALLGLYLEYLKRESVYLALFSSSVRLEMEPLARRRAAVDFSVAHLREELKIKGDVDKKTQELMRLEAESRTSARARDDILRELGRIEGELSLRDRLLLGKEEEQMPVREAREFAENILTFDNIAEIIFAAKSFLQRLTKSSTPATSDTPALAAKKSELERRLRDLHEKDENTNSSIVALRKNIENEKDQSREAERELFAHMAERSEIESALARVHAKEEILKREEQSFKSEMAEAGALLGVQALAYDQYKITIEDESRVAQEERRKKLERMKIRLEESGAGNSAEVLKEFSETSERDKFLARELSDLDVSTQKLRALIAELTQTLKERFVGGIEKINKEFDEFFKLMFGGGSASLQIVKEKKLRSDLDSNLDDGEDAETEEGIEVSVSLPHKRLKGLHALSGGERALTSIALIFAMSQVNPPPFLILDETDAALDEANSRRYGDLIERLARKSQLILITHNRETMSRASTLYGVTMGQDGVSKLLSIKFEEAVAVAK